MHGRRGWGATGRSSCTRPTRCGHSSSSTAPRRSPCGRGSKRSDSCQVRYHRPRSRSRRARRLALSSRLSRTGSRRQRSARESRIRSCARRSREPPPRALPERPPAVPSGRLRRARKRGVCRAFFMTEASYTAKDITVLEGLEPVRLRSGMYIGSTGARGLHHLVYEVVDNAVDEALAGRNDRIDVVLHPDNSVTVRDYGSGIPVDVMREQGLPALTVVLTKLHAGGKFGGEGYKVSGGLHGVGVSVVNALSFKLVAEVYRDGKVYRQEFKRGEPVTDMAVVGKTEKSNTGTMIAFLPDAEVFDEVELSAETLVQRLRETAFLTRGLRIKLTDERADGKTVEFHYEGGIRDFVAHVNAAKDPVHKTMIYFEGETDQGSVEVAMQWNASYQESVFTFANNVNTVEGGAHLSGFRSALTRTLNTKAQDLKLLKKEESLDGEDVREGLAAVVSVKLRNPQF